MRIGRKKAAPYFRLLIRVFMRYKFVFVFLYIFLLRYQHLPCSSEIPRRECKEIYTSRDLFTEHISTIPVDRTGNDSDTHLPTDALTSIP